MQSRPPSMLAFVTGFLALAGSTGCATVMHGVRQTVSVTSEPPGAEVFIGGKRAGVTPLWLNLKRRGDRVSLLELLAIDALTGAAYKLPKTVRAILHPLRD